MSRVFLSFGSNLGDRLAYLRAAVDAVGRGPRMRIVGVSKVYETEPVEVEGNQPEYLNCVVEVECSISAPEILRYCQGVEAALGRVDKGGKAPRTVDVDVLLFGAEMVDDPDFGLPHRGITRAFNLRGLADLDPSLYIPGRGVVSELLSEADLEGVRELEGAERLC